MALALEGHNTILTLSVAAQSDGGPERWRP
jgi:hypothetical protein